jgi:hypothetical protein
MKDGITKEKYRNPRNTNNRRIRQSGSEAINN